MSTTIKIHGIQLPLSIWTITDEEFGIFLSRWDERFPVWRPLLDRPAGRNGSSGSARLWVFSRGATVSDGSEKPTPEEETAMMHFIYGFVLGLRAQENP